MLHNDKYLFLKNIFILILYNIRLVRTHDSFNEKTSVGLILYIHLE